MVEVNVDKFYSNRALYPFIPEAVFDALEAFCTLYDLSAPRYREMRLTYGVSPKPGYQSRYKNIEVEAIYSLVVNYPISSRWLITGRGKMLIE